MPSAKASVLWRDCTHSELRMPCTNAEFYLLRSAMFVAQVIVCDMEKSGLDTQIETICRNISKVTSKLSGNLANDPLCQVGSGGRIDNNAL